MKKYLYLIKNSKIPTYLKYWLMYSSKKISLLIQSLPITLENTIKDLKIVINKIYGNTIQDGIPSPDNEVPISNVTGDVEVVVENKNLFDKQNANTLNTAIGVDSLGANVPGVYLSVYIKCKANTTYTVSRIFDTTKNRFAVAYTEDVPNYNMPVKGVISNPNVSQLTITTGASARYLVAYVWLSGGTFNQNDIINSIQIEQNTVATNYVEHKEQTLPLTLGNIELCKIGDYQDYLYKNNGKWYVHKNTGKVVLDGSENWVTGSFGTNSYLLRIIGIKYPLNANDTGLFIKSSHFRGIPITSRLTSGDNLIYVEPSPFINIRNTPFTSLSDFKTWLSTHNTIAYYILETPTDTEITDTALISQLEAINNAKSYEGQTNISSNQNIYLDIDYIKRG